MANVFYLLLGWLLGLLSPIIHDRIKRLSAKKELKEGIFNELKEIKSRMTMTVGLISTRSGTFDRELFNWVSNHLDEYEGMFSTEMLERFKNISKLNDKDLTAIWEMIKLQKAGSALSLKPYRAPFMDSRIGSLSFLDVEDQKKITEIRARITLLNDDIEQLRFYYEKTFTPGLTEENYKIILDNQKHLYQTVGVYLRDIVDLISHLISK